MKNQLFAEVVNRSAIMSRYQEGQKPVVYPFATYPPVDWTKRRAMKNRVCLKYVGIVLGIALVSGLFFIMPFWALSPELGKSAFVALPCMLAMTLSWMVGAWWAWDKARLIFLSVTVACTPVRLALCLLYSAIVLPYVREDVFIFSLMVHWVAFIIPEMAMIRKLSKLGFVPQVEEL